LAQTFECTKKCLFFNSLMITDQVETGKVPKSTTHFIPTDDYYTHNKCHIQICTLLTSVPENLWLLCI
jgi:hypothetical protein